MTQSAIQKSNQSFKDHVYSCINYKKRIEWHSQQFNGQPDSKGCVYYTHAYYGKCES
jgi:hypothetical protein